MMGIVKTYEWLEKDYRDPVKVCEKLVPYYKNKTATEIYKQLLEYGMYQPSRQTWDIVETMNNEKTWAQIKGYYEKYQKKWSGPDIPIFLFPLNQSRGLFKRSEKGKSGVSFPDKMFLFLSDLDDPKELESLFVHEYHHVCRLNKLKGNMDEYTLLDSMIIEGLAEYEVLKSCGEKYLAKWCKMYSEKEMEGLWERFLSDSLNSKKKERIHDYLLYGHGRIPRLLGYSAGFLLVQKYFTKNQYSTKRSFSIPASKFID